jgi:hypothetical protein
MRRALRQQLRKCLLQHAQFVAPEISECPEVVPRCCWWSACCTSTRTSKSGDRSRKLSVMRGMGSRDLAAAKEMINGAIARAQLDPRTEYYLAMTTLDGHFLGFARLGLDGVKAGKLGYAVRADQWSKGYATDAARTMIDFGFDKLGLHRISAAIAPNNAASIIVAERLGMKREGVTPYHVFTNHMWARLRAVLGALPRMGPVGRAA